MKFGKGDVVYAAKMGKGIVEEVRGHLVFVQHERGGIACYDSEGRAPHGQLHFFGEKKA